MSGIIRWTYFIDSLSQISITFTANACLFNIIYFPRLIMPIFNKLFNSPQIIVDYNHYKIKTNRRAVFFLKLIGLDYLENGQSIRELHNLKFRKQHAY